MVIDFAPMWKLSSSVAQISALPSNSSARQSTISNNKSDRFELGPRHAPQTGLYGAPSRPGPIIAGN